MKDLFCKNFRRIAKYIFFIVQANIGDRQIYTIFLDGIRGKYLLIYEDI